MYYAILNYAIEEGLSWEGIKREKRTIPIFLVFSGREDWPFAKSWSSQKNTVCIGTNTHSKGKDWPSRGGS